MKRVYLTFQLLLLAAVVFASQTIELPSLVYPKRIRLDNEQIYFVDGAQIHIFSQKDFKKIKTFGKKGAGPGEFNVHPGTPIMINVQGKNIVLQTGWSVYEFSKKGEYISERKGTHMGICAQPVGDRYVAISYSTYDNPERTRYFQISLYNSTLNNKIKEIAQVPDEYQRRKGLSFLALPRSYTTSFTVYDDKVFVALQKDLSVNVFDSAGNKLYTIRKDVEKIPVTNDYKKSVVNFFKTDHFQKQFYEIMLKPITFPEYFPGIRDMRVADDKVYLETYKKDKNGKSEFYIFDIKGKFLNRVFLPVIEMDFITQYPFDFKNDKLYQIVEKEEETWELRIIDVK